MTTNETTEKIVFRLVRTNVFTRWPCHICGGETEKVPILCESGGETKVGLRICERCLSCRDFDAHLESHAQALEAQAAQTRALIGRIEAPSFAEWKQAMADDDADWERVALACVNEPDDDVSIDDLRTRYVDQSNWRRNEQDFPYIEIAGRVVALYPWAEGWTWMIYRGGPEPLAWLADPARLYADGVSDGESDARDDAWKAFRADLEKLKDPIGDNWF
jgi:hypothetical protein